MAELMGVSPGRVSQIENGDLDVGMRGRWVPGCGSSSTTAATSGRSLEADRSGLPRSRGCAARVEAAHPTAYATDLSARSGRLDVDGVSDSPATAAS
ncbi:hypothetical protein ACWKSP_07200 [Micromonosporaceae bacterium Da 78-11]